MSKFDTIYSELDGEIKNLKSVFLDKYFPVSPEHTPNIFEYDVKSFSVLAHASFEEYIEEISDQILQDVCKDFILKKISLATISLIITYAERQKAEPNDKEEAEGDLQHKKCFDIIRDALNSCKTQHSISIKDNHGFSTKYMRKVLQPVGINIPSAPDKVDAIKKLSNVRGSFAHRKSKQAQYGEYKRVQTPLSPEDAWRIVQDCLSACYDIKESAQKRW